MDGPDLDIGEVVAAPPQQSLRHPFHRDLDDVRHTIARLSATVTEDILRATDVLLTQDLDEAERMIVADDEVDATCVDVEQRCYRLLALQAPVASDLREIVAALRIIAAIERSADLAVNICNTARRIYGHSLPPRIRGHIRRMGTQASRLFREASEAYLLNDAVRAAAIRDMDDLLDDLQRQFVAALFDTPDGIDLPTAVQLAMLARFYERIGDHAVTIGDRVTYLITGTLHKHRD
jgi:phosphate transport system protein